MPLSSFIVQTHTDTHLPFDGNSSTSESAIFFHSFHIISNIILQHIIYIPFTVTLTFILHICILFIGICARKFNTPLILPVTDFAVSVIINLSACPYWLDEQKRQTILKALTTERVFRIQIDFKCVLGKSTEKLSCSHLDQRLCCVPKKHRPQNLKWDQMRATGRGRFVCMCVTVCVLVQMIEKEEVSEYIPTGMRLVDDPVWL